MSASHSNSRCPGSVDALSYPGCYEVRKLPGLCKHKVDRTFTLEKRRPIQRCSKKYLPSGTKYYPMAIFVCLIQFDYCHLNSAPLHEFQPPPPPGWFPGTHRLTPLHPYTTPLCVQVADITNSLPVGNRKQYSEQVNALGNITIITF